VKRAIGPSIATELVWPGRDLRLTGRESELLALLPTGMTNRELAAHLCLSENTIKTQLRGLFSKLDVRNRVQAVEAARSGLLGEQRRRSVAEAEGDTSEDADGPR
jgi:DNA-binding CsgD family transcriptional regulator